MLPLVHAAACACCLSSRGLDDGTCGQQGLKLEGAGKWSCGTRARDGRTRQSGFNPTLRKGHFSQEEDEALRHAVPKFTIASESSRDRASAEGQVNVVNWKAVAGEMPHVRRPDQLQERWRALCQEVDRIEADAGGGAADEGQSASGSTQMVVRGRRKVSRLWTPEEDRHLMEVVAHHRLDDKNVWLRIAEQIPDRDRKACRERFEKLQPHLSLQARVERELREQMVPRAGAQLGSRAKVREPPAA